MSKIYPHLEYLPDEDSRRSNPNLETNCGQIFSKGSAFTRDIIEKLEDADLGPKQTVLCGYEFKARQLWVLSGLLFLLIASLMGTVLMFGTSMFDGFVLSQILITKDTVTYKSWKGPGTRAFLKVHIFNYTNVDEYERGYADKLHVQDIGPFVYEEIGERVNVKFHPNGTVSYQDQRSHKYRADLSKGRKQGDQVVVPNMPVLGAAAMSKHSYYVTRLTMSAFLTGLNAKPFLRLPAHRFIWGYDDSFFALARGVMSYQKKLPFERFGILAARNGTSPDVITINTGFKNVNKLGLIDKFNGESKLNHWSTDECNSIQGTDGMMFPPFTIRQKKPVYVYQKEFCRRVPFQFEKEVKLLNNKVKAYRYTLPETVFDSAEVDVENQCFCDVDSGVCPPQGVFNATPCAFGAPLFLSFPHFYKADPAVKNAVSGLNPNPKNIENYLDIHPSLGFALGGKNQMQVNVQVHKSFGMSQMDMFKEELLLPVAWVDMGMEAKDLPDSIKEDIYQASLTVPAVEMSLQYGCLLTAIVTSTAILIILRGKWMEKRQKLAALQRNISMQSGAPLMR